MASKWGEAGQGALGGAATGAAIGSVVPGVGTAIGAGLGGLLGGAMGYFGAEDEFQADPAAARLQTGGFQRGGAQDVYRRAFAGRQVPGLRGLQGQLTGIAGGTQAGAGELAARRMGARSIGQIGSQAMGARGFGAAGLAAQAGRQIADVGTQTAGMAAESAIQDQERARQALLATMETELRARGMDDAAIAQALDQLARTDIAELQARMQQEGYRFQQSQAPSVGAGLLQTGGTALSILPQVTGTGA